MWLLEDRDPTLFYSSIKISEFLIVLTPPKDICDDVSKFKTKLKNHFGRFESMHSKAHFTLANFLCNEEQEKKIIPTFKKIETLTQPFKVELNGFQSFKYSGTIYLDPINKENIYDLSKLIFKELILNGFSKKNLIIPKTPHLTIARKLNKIQFELALAEFNQSSYNKTFEACEINVLKRNEKKKYELYQTIKLKN